MIAFLAAVPTILKFLFIVIGVAAALLVMYHIIKGAVHEGVKAAILETRKRERPKQRT